MFHLLMPKPIFIQSHSHSLLKLVWNIFKFEFDRGREFKPIRNIDFLIAIRYWLKAAHLFENLLSKLLDFIDQLILLYLLFLHDCSVFLPDLASLG